MNTEGAVTLLRNRADQLRQRCNAKINSLGTVAKETETEEQRQIRNSAQSDFDIADELDRLVEQIQRS